MDELKRQEKSGTREEEVFGVPGIEWGDHTQFAEPTNNTSKVENGCYLLKLVLMQPLPLGEEDSGQGGRRGPRPPWFASIVYIEDGGIGR